MFNVTPCEGEWNNEPSCTVPDQAMSMREILARFAKGLPLGGSRESEAYYDEENDLPDLRTLDLSERVELLEHYRAEVKRLKSELEGPQPQPDPHPTATPENPKP